MNEVRQCRIEGHKDFGAVAVHNADADLWGIFNPTGGGRWSTPDEAEVIASSWTELAAKIQ